MLEKEPEQKIDVVNHLLDGGIRDTRASLPLLPRRSGLCGVDLTLEFGEQLRSGCSWEVLRDAQLVDKSLHDHFDPIKVDATWLILRRQDDLNHVIDHDVNQIL